MKVLRPHGRWGRSLSPSADLLPKNIRFRVRDGGKVGRAEAGKRLERLGNLRRPVRLVMFFAGLRLGF